MKPSRYLTAFVAAALEKKMAFIGGPRQVGKTTLALDLLGPKATEKHPAYFNFDNPLSAARLKRADLPPDEPLLIIDEIHKYAKWRGLVKGIFDTEKSTRKIIVTGSARLDYYRKGGDSLLGRYRYFRLHPFSLLELNENPSSKDLQKLLKFSGFPESLFGNNEAEHRIWQRDRLHHVVQQDLRDLEHVREVSLVEDLVSLLPSKVGSPLSVQSLREDIGVDHKTVERWIQILENLYVCFRVPPFGSKKIRAVKKERKLYLWDWSAVPGEGERFENLVASQLLKYCHLVEDTEGHAMELRFLRDTDKREVDFVVLKDGVPLFAVECQTGERAISPAIKYFEERLAIPTFYQVHMGSKSFQTGRVRVLPFIEFCKQTKMP